MRCYYNLTYSFLAILTDGSSEKEAIDQLINDLKDQTKVLQASAEISKLGSKGVLAAVEVGKILLVQDEKFKKIWILQCLGDMEKNAKGSIPYVLEMLKDEDRYVRFATIEILGNMGVNDKKVMTAILEYRVKDDNIMKIVAYYALIKLDPSERPSNLKNLVSFTQRIHPGFVRSTALASIQKLGALAEEARPALIELLDGAENLDFQIAVQQTLKIITKK